MHNEYFMNLIKNKINTKHSKEYQRKMNNTSISLKQVYTRAIQEKKFRTLLLNHHGEACMINVIKAYQHIFNHILS